MELLTAVAVGMLFAVGIFQLLRRNMIRSVIGIVILATAVNLFLLATGAYEGIAPAYVGEDGMRSDALPQALILTAIVISMGGTAFVLSILYLLTARYRTADMDQVDRLKH